ncbi:MFS transporter [Zunongwangia sp.]|uniref:MFS transporter n=1 Tax=Zunongwangia sp. TaxID=1965325 RepID=UPI003AA904C5
MASEKNQQIFREWVPDWLILIAIFLTLIPIASVLGIYLGGLSSAASYYGVDNTDIKYSVVVFYIAIATAFPLEKHFFNRFASKPYIVGCSIIFVLLNLLLYFSKNFAILLVFRFLGGMLSLGFIGTMFTLIFRQFHAQRSRVLGYATLYASLLGSAPLCQLLDAYVFTEYDFNIIFLFKIYGVIPGLLLLTSFMKNSVDLRSEGKIILERIDWKSFILYASGLLSLAYTLLYGQYYQWFSNQRIVFTCIGAIFFLLCFVFRQLKLDRPYINLSIFKIRNFRIGMLLLVVFYFSKGDLSVLYGYMANSVNLDVYHKSYLMISNAFGIVAGAALTARFVLAKTSIRLVWITGFLALLGFHVYSLFLLSANGEGIDLLIPLFLQGFGNGTLMLSIVIFYATSVPKEIAFSASVTGVGFRATTFTASMALVAFMSLHQQKIHKQHFSEEITSTNQLANNRLAGYQQVFKKNGASSLQAKAGSKKLMAKAIGKQTNLLFARDYYLYMSIFIGIVILGIALIPHFHYQLRKIGDKLIPI